VSQDTPPYRSAETSTKFDLVPQRTDWVWIVVPIAVATVALSLVVDGQTPANLRASAVVIVIVAALAFAYWKSARDNTWYDQANNFVELGRDSLRLHMYGAEMVIPYSEVARAYVKAQSKKGRDTIEVRLFTKPVRRRPLAWFFLFYKSIPLFFYVRRGGPFRHELSRHVPVKWSGAD
jgi:hypothetical protein